MDDKDIDEIINHIQKLKKADDVADISPDNRHNEKDEANMKTSSITTQERNDHKESIKPAIKKEKDDLTGPMDTFEDIEPVSIMTPEIVGWTDGSTVPCDVCEKEIILGKNLSGLVVSDEFFACEHCCQELSKDELMEWTRSKMVSSTGVRPIGLWVIEQQRENKAKNVNTSQRNDIS